jgi:hypothetical protein
MGTVDEQSRVTNPPENVARDVRRILEQRRTHAPFDVAVDGVTNAGERGLVGEYEGAGATWWFEAIHLSRASEPKLLERIAAGPPA